MKKAHLSVYLDPQTSIQVSQLAARKGQSKSLIAETAIMAFLSPDESDQREAAFTRRLDLLTRQAERLERNVTVAVETLALFIRFWLAATPSLSDSAQQAAQAKGRERFEGFLDALGRRLASGQTLLREVPLDQARDRAPS
jgi:predicted transcriptional regulator